MISAPPQSNVGPVHTALLQGAVEALLTDVLVPLLNAVLRTGSRKGPGAPPGWGEEKETRFAASNL